MKDIIVILVIAAIIISAALYIRSSRKKGRKCIGCPGGGECASCNGSCEQRK